MFKAEEKQNSNFKFCKSLNKQKTISKDSIRETESRSSFFSLNQGDTSSEKNENVENNSQPSNQDLGREVKGGII